MTATAPLLANAIPYLGAETFPKRRQHSSRGPSEASTLDSKSSVLDTNRPDLLLNRLGQLSPGDARRAGVRATAIEWYLPMTVSLARRYGGRGEPLADLMQVAAIALIKAVDRYDAARGVPFVSYAIPTIVGELKRHFRDTTWKIRVPRPMQELSLQLNNVTEDLTHRLHRSPTTAELAARLGVSSADVVSARRCANAYRPLSLDQPSPNTEELSLIDSLGGPDPAIEAVDTREALRLRLAELPEREQRIITLRYFREMTQAQIAADIGVSQMQISRLLARSLAYLHAGLVADAETLVEFTATGATHRQVPTAA